ncbi:MAG: GTPase domain-containing protein [Candidatus Odinarchaeia archaeon]
MLHRVIIYGTDGKLILSKNLSSEGEKLIINENIFEPIINETYNSESKTSYLIIKDYKLIFKIKSKIPIILIADEDDSNNVLDEYAERILRRFMIRYGDSAEGIDKEEITFFGQIIVDLVTRPAITLKILLMGEPNTGKTSIFKILNNEKPPERYIPSVEANGREFADITDEAILYIWDLPGREEHRWLWERYIIGADIIFIVTNSTTPNLLSTMEAWATIRQNLSKKIKVYGLANMQDKKDALDADVVGNILGYKTFPISSKSLEGRIHLVNVFKNVCERYIIEDLESRKVQIEKESEEIIDSILSIRDGLLKYLPPNHPIFVSIDSWLEKLKSIDKLEKTDLEKLNEAIINWREKLKEITGFMQETT